MKELEKIKKNFIGLVGKKKLTEIFTDFFELTALAIKSSVCSISTNFPEDIEKNIGEGNEFKKSNGDGSFFSRLWNKLFS